MIKTESRSRYMEFEEFSGKTVDEALMNAALKLQTVSPVLFVD